MANLRRWLGRSANLSRVLPRAVSVTWALVMAWVFILAVRDHHPEFASRDECATHPQDFLREGELLDTVSLRFLVRAHCSNARYLSDDRIALPYVGGVVDVETRTLRIGGETYYRIVSVSDVKP